MTTDYFVRLNYVTVLMHISELPMLPIAMLPMLPVFRAKPSHTMSAARSLLRNQDFTSIRRQTTNSGTSLLASLGCDRINRKAKCAINNVLHML
jgi:hypothetical protein